MPTESPAAVQWKPLVVCPHRELARRIRGVLLEMGISEIRLMAEYPRSGETGAQGHAQQSNICFLDVASNGEQAMPLISEFSASMPVVALHPHKDADLILRCLRRGAFEFLSDASADAVREIFERMARSRAPQPTRRQGTFYCVIPGKAGAGASTVAAHVALQFRSGGERKVLLVDADPLAGSIGFMLKLKSEFHLGDVLRDWQRMDEDLWKRLTVPCAGMDVLLAPEMPALRFDLGRPPASELANFWRERYDAVIVDVPDLRVGVEWGLAAAADQILLVTTNELAATHATRRAIELLDQSIGDRARVRLIVNRYAPALGLKREDLKAVLHVEPFAVLAGDYEMVQDALLEGKPVASRSAFRTSVQGLCRKLAGEPAPARKNGSLLGFFRSRK